MTPSYADKTTHRYAHFVDGGITDNLGLRALLESVEVIGGATDFLEDDEASPRHGAWR